MLRKLFTYVNDSDLNRAGVYSLLVTQDARIIDENMNTTKGVQSGLYNSRTVSNGGVVHDRLASS